MQVFLAEDSVDTFCDKLVSLVDCVDKVCLSGIVSNICSYRLHHCVYK